VGLPGIANVAALGIRTLESQAGQIRQELRKLNARAINAPEEAALH
jgi:hypothetical protein